MQRLTPSFFSATLLALGLAAAPAVAQTTPPVKPGLQAPAQGYTNDQLQKFAGASKKIAVIADQYRPRLQAAQDDTAREKIFKEADEKMVKVVHADGLTVDEFNGIGQAVQQDPQLKQRVQDMTK